MNKIFDCIIVGAGPSGLTAGEILSEANLDFIIVDKGTHLYNRKRDNPMDIVAGVGGGGLFSDGKVSFYPAGSNVYLLNAGLVVRSYKRLRRLFDNFSIAIPDFNLKWTKREIETATDVPFLHKHYESIVLSQEDLFGLGFCLYDQIGKERFLLGHSVLRIQFESPFYIVEVINNASGNSKTFKARNVIFGGGKFGSLSLSSFMDERDLVFKKFEFGIRVETDHENFDYKDLEQTDLKILIKKEDNPGIEFRTFCFCRNGYIVHGKFGEIDSFNGVSNQPSFTKTNFGINMRISDKALFESLKSDLAMLEKSESIINQELADFLKERNSNWSEIIYKTFQDCLLTSFQNLSGSRATVTGPSFEYFGYYPVLNDELKLPDQNFWVCGDATGDFRGLLPSLLSGYVAAFSLLAKSKKDQRLLYDLIRLKISPTSTTRTVFTAQSKKFFYAKDVICEFVFAQGLIPINPFQAFGYFLNDRVDRGLVRNGNNELIRRSDEVWVFGPIADGVLFEISRAYELNLPIRFFTVGTTVNEIVEITDLNKLVFEPEVYSQVGRDNLLRFISQSYYSDPPQSFQLNFGFDDVPHD